jgi:hypothetical protein
MYMHAFVKSKWSAARGQALCYRQTGAMAWTCGEAYECRREYLSKRRHAMTRLPIS